jgi:hypothetical protein
VRSTRVPPAEPVRAPVIRSPSQWPGTGRGAIAAGRSARGVRVGSGPRRSVPRARGRRALRACRRAAHRALRRAPRGNTSGPHRGARARGVSACRQETRGGTVRPSVRASRPPPAAPAHTATARDPGVCGVAGADRRARRSGPVPYRRERGGPAWGGGPTRGSRCGGRVPTLGPSSGAKGQGPGPRSPSHGLPHSCVERIALAGQPRSPSGPAVWHWEFELKHPLGGTLYR